MIDLNNLESYRENNRIEAKKALGGFPHSVWETYSAFANTLGGIILLGVEEKRDHTLHAVDLPCPEKLIKVLWDTVNDSDKISANILSEKNVSVKIVDGKRIIVIEVPRARRLDKPVYVGVNAYVGSYRRNGEGDYRCTKAEVDAMLRDASTKSRDMTVLEGFDLNVFDSQSLKNYRERFKKCKQAHAFNNLSDDEFLLKTGAAGIARDKKIRPTAAGLLAFGKVEDVKKAFLSYSLEYRDTSGCESAFYKSLVERLKDSPCNVFDFYCRASDCLTRYLKDLKNEFKLSDKGMIAVTEALLEALANTLINADYFAKDGVVVTNYGNSVVFSNPGGLRIDLKTAKTGGVSDPRNSALTKIFGLIDVGSGSGSGIPKIFAVWKGLGWSVPHISEEFEPERITLNLPLGKASADKSSRGSLKIGDKEKRIITETAKRIIIEYLTRRASATVDEMVSSSGIERLKLNEYLDMLVADDIVVCDESCGEFVYRLKR